MADRIQHRRDTVDRWTSINPVLLEGEIGYVIDNPNQHKIGDGIHAWNDLPLRGFNGNISQQLGDDENAVVSQKAVTKIVSDIRTEVDNKISELELYVLNTTCNFNVDYNSKKISVSSGYVMMRDKSEFPISAHEFNFGLSENAKFIYFNTETNKFGCVDYSDGVQEKWMACGCVNTGNSNVIINGLDLQAKKEIEENNAVINERLSDVESLVGGAKVTIPSNDYLEGAFDVGGGGGVADSIYYDTRCVISDKNPLKSISILSGFESGIISVYFIATSDNRIVTKKDVNVYAGKTTTIEMEIESSLYSEPMYVGLNGNGVYWQMKSGQPTTYNRKQSISTGEVSSISYASAYTITYIGESELDKKIEASTKGLNDRVAELEQKIGGSEVTLPSEDYLDEIFDIDFGGGASDVIYYDSRYIISRDKPIKRVSVLATGYEDSSKMLTIYFIAASSNEIVYQKTVEVERGKLNDINIELDESLYSEPMYVGLGSDRSYWMMKSGQPTTYNMKRSISTGEVTPITYSSAYTITYIDNDGSIGSNKNAIVYYDTIEEALASGVDDIVLAPKDIYVKSPVVLREGMTIRGSFGKTRLILANGCKTAITASNVNNIKISDIEIVGSCPTYKTEMNGVVSGDGYELVSTEEDALNLRYMGEEKGIYLYYCENVVIDNVKINHIAGSAIRVNHTGMDYTRGLNSTNVFITNCYNGIYTENEHEFSQYTNFAITSCMIGIYISSGNLIFSSGHVTRCRVGIQIVDGYNTAHGIIQGVEVKHNQLYGILVNGVVLGESFVGCYVSYSNVKLNNSSGVTFDTLYMGSGVVSSENTLNVSGKNYIGKLFNRGNASVIQGGNLAIGETINLHEP